MKKKVIRRVSATKKTVSKKILAKKKKFSPKLWLVGGLTLFLAVALGYYFLQPKPLKVLELAGKIEDYIVPNPVDINQLVSSKTPKSDIPELNAAAAAVQAKKAGLSDTAQKQAAKKAAEDTIRQNAEIAVRQKSTSTDPKKIEEEKANIIKKAQDAIRDEAPVIADKAMEAASRVKVNDDGTITIDPTVGSNSPITQGGSCSAANGAQVLSGSTVIGDVEKTEGDNYNKNKVYECLNGVWKFANRYCGTGEAMLNCDITLKPTYALKEGQKNCYQGSTIVGDGQVTDTQDGKKQCKNGAFVSAVELNGRFLSDEEYKKEIAKLQNACVSNGGTWNDNLKICGVGQDACERDKGVWNHTTRTCNYVSGEDERNCASKGSGYEWISATKECKPKANTQGRTEVCQAQGTVAVCRVYDENKNLVSSRQSNITENCLPNGNEVFCTQSVTDSSGKVVELRQFKKDVTIKQVNPSGKFQNGELTSDEKLCIYGGEPTGFGVYGYDEKKHYETYRCKDSTGAVPHSFNAGATEGFGGPANSTPETPFSNSFSNFETWSACVNDAGKTQDEACIKTPDGKYSQVPDDNPNVSCNFWGCQWKVDTTESENTPATSGDSLINPDDQQRTANQVAIGSLGCVAVAGAFAISTGGLGLPALGLCASGALAGTIIGSLIP